ncbi:MAG: hypothetical protein RRA35_11105, partial [Desulfomonilia bacterium]|nr:hypothetical protein [Desulfomonilia bacterium]
MGSIFVCENHDGIAVVKFDVPSEAVNTWTEAAVDDFEKVLVDLEAQKSQYRGVVFISGKANNFHAGANLNVLGGSVDLDAFHARCTFFNELFLRLE